MTTMTGPVPSSERVERWVRRVGESRLFDADWYAAAHPEVGASGMEPARHFVLVGDRLGHDPGPRFVTDLWRDLRPDLRDAPAPALLQFETARRREGPIPMPDRRNVLLLAGMLDRAGESARAIALAERHLPPALVHAAAALHANAALAVGQEDLWLHHLNGVLARAGLAPIRLDGEGPLIERLGTAPLPPVPDGPLVSVLMPAWNAQATVEAAARSILRQTWRRIELVIVDDASTDGTGEVLGRIASADGRVRVLRLPVNSGPFVAKNVGLALATGDWVTGHDSDDWAHPQRIEHHLRAALGDGGPRVASMTTMIRIEPSGRFSFLDRVGVASPDGVTRRAPVSILFECSFLRSRLGHWDSVRFAADGEMVGRLSALLGEGFATFDQPSMLTLDRDASLSNHAEHGVDKVHGRSPVRAAYREAWHAWHASLGADGDARLPLVQEERRFPVPDEMRVTVGPEVAVLAGRSRT